MRFTHSSNSLAFIWLLFAAPDQGSPNTCGVGPTAALVHSFGECSHILLLLPLVRTLQKLQKAAFKHKMLIIPSGARESIRFLPPLMVSAQQIDLALETFEACCKEVFG